MQQNPEYGDVVEDLLQFFRQRIEACTGTGIPRERLLLDPGFGFGKRLEHNVALLARLERFTELGRPLLVGISRKSMIGALLGDAPVSERLHGSVAAALFAMERGAAIIRVHDVRPTVDALTVIQALRCSE
jgi:dihydropteroate synthase